MQFDLKKSLIGIAAGLVLLSTGVAQTVGPPTRAPLNPAFIY
jgi:hypothetical protein